MEAIATLIQHDPYLDLPASERIAAKRERRARMSSLQAPLKILPPVTVAPAPAPIEPPDLRCMWFYNLIFETEILLSTIVARPSFHQRAPRIDEIQVEVARYYDVRRTDILSARRTAVIVLPRQVGYWLCAKLTGKSLPEIGRRFGARDHSSIFYGVRKIEALRLLDPKLQADLNVLASALGGSIA